MLIVARAGARHKRMRRMVSLVRLASAVTRREASAVHAEEAVAAVQHFGFLPGRMACLESSVATVVALALEGRAVTWHHGVRCDPIVLHAWISVGGVPVAEPPSTLRCTPLLTIASKRTRKTHE
ncbi:lasso peptide biosynthesis B2 protein [Actinomadura meridiana]